MTIVGIGYKQRRGKDTAADALVRELGFRKVAFADPLKDLALEANPVVLTEPGFVNVQIGHNSLRQIVESRGWEYAKDHYPLVRPFLQRLGQGGRKVFGPNFWLEQWEDRVGINENVVVPDVRFRNEAEGLKGLGALLVRIDRVVPSVSDSDVSETELDGFDDWDLVISNSGSIYDLERTIIEFVAPYLTTPKEAA